MVGKFVLVGILRLPASRVNLLQHAPTVASAVRMLAAPQLREHLSSTLEIA